uniref:Acetyl-coenzyme A carboxylase carboxyl transferase subunit beta, chloroplastic n=1 Tax=Ipomoea purpurea TaxID=4121 RepID=ACCD_IPOPU|nr:acetyl-CoA carboxylase beta subunit [Ipomoea purpurea]A7Y3E9.1 RecName: Full=Acetyl-coenzyme A carboxylase carboxyl transferase subunit beta, chloroplastic; Short=ACCase subunit beta; Short=Acetyl-CoA carboxylase carboxyltransferase subunit beta [Ipomoea purpurea]ABV02357.1 acetyl-CoA carboxylase carboxyltransferase beta subunit [Ipomoea purpurea]
MEKWRIYSFQKEFERRCGLNSSLGPIETTGEDPNRKDTVKNIQSWEDCDNSSCSNVDHLFGVKDNENFISDDTFVVFDIENQIFEIDNDHSFLNEPFSSYSDRNSSYLTNVFTSEDPYYNRYMYDAQYSWNNHINGCIDSYLQSQICIDTTTVSGSDNDSYDIHGSVCDGESHNSSEGESSSRRTHTKGVDLTIRESSNENERESSNENERKSSNDLDRTKKYRDLWLQCENCYGLNYKKFLKSKMNICEQCGYHLKMSSSDRIELLIDPGTWDPMDEYMVSQDPIEFDSEGEQEQEQEQEQEEEETYKDRIDFYQTKTGLTEAVQTGIGQLNGIPVAIGVMDFHFLGGSMGSVVGEKITRLIEHATNNFLPLIIVCASGGARMQEGSLSLMQMAKISSALYEYQLNKRLFYVSILTSPTTGGVTASFGMLGDVIIVEPNAYVAFAGKRVIEQTLNQTVPEGSQEAEYLFEKGLFDLIVPRHLLKSVLSELFEFHALFPLNQNSNQVEC